MTVEGILALGAIGIFFVGVFVWLGIEIAREENIRWRTCQSRWEREHMERVVAKATEVMGSKEEALLWLKRPAMWLDGKAPISLLVDLRGTEQVLTYLMRLEYGVHA